MKLWKFNEHVLVVIFVLYVILLVVEKVMLHFQSRSSDATSASRLALYLTFVITLFLYVVQIVRSSGTKAATGSTSPVIMLLVLYGFQQFVDNSVKFRAGEKTNASLQFNINAGVVVGLLTACLLLHATHTHIENNATYVLYTVVLAVAIAFCVFMGLTLKKEALSSMVKYNIAKAQFPMLITVLCIIVYLNCILHRNQLQVSLQPDFLADASASLIVSAPIILVWFLGDGIGQLQKENDELVLQKFNKLLVIAKEDPDATTLLPLIQQVLAQATGKILTLNNDEKSVERLLALLYVPASSVLLSVNNLPTSSSIDVSILLENSVKHLSGNASFSISEFLQPSQKSDEPLNPVKSLKTSFANSALLKVVVASILLAAFLGLVVRHPDARSDTWLNSTTILVLSAIGITGYASSVMGYIFFGINNLHQAVCSGSPSSREECIATSNRLGSLEQSLNQLINEGGEVSFRDRRITGNDQASLISLYSTMITTDISTQILNYKNAFQAAITLAQSSALAAYNATAVYRGPGVMHDTSVSDIMSWLTDADRFALCLGLPAYHPLEGSVAIPVTNSYIYIDAQDPPELHFTAYGTETLLAALTVVKQSMITLKGMIYAESDDWLGQMNIRLLQKLYSNNNFNIAAFDNAYFLQILQTMLQEYISSRVVDNLNTEILWNSIAEPGYDWDNIKSQFYMNIGSLASYTSLYNDDRTIINDVLQQAIRNTTTYDQQLNKYLNAFFWIVKINMVKNISTVQSDITYLEKKGFPVMTGCAFATILLLALALFVRMGFTVGSPGRLSDYFVTAVSGSKLSANHNSLFIGTLTTFLLGMALYMVNMYSFEDLSVKNLLIGLQTSTKSWNARVSTMALLLCVTLCIIATPLLAASYTERKMVVIGAFLSLAALCSPLAMKGTPQGLPAAANSIFHMYTVSTLPTLLAVLAVSWCLYKFSDKPVLQNVLFRRFMWITLFTMTLVFASVPSLYLHWTEPDMQDSEYFERIKLINLSMFISFGVLVVMTVVYLLIMRRVDLFTNKFPISKANVYTTDLLLG